MKKKNLTPPTALQLENELQRIAYRRRYRRALNSTIYTLITVAAVAVLVATLIMPVLQIFGSSMAPTLQDGEIVLSLKTSDLKQGDVVAFYYNNKILGIWRVGGYYSGGRCLREQQVVGRTLSGPQVSG